MKSILNSCEPRSDIIAGTFNPEIFTASLSEVFRFYSGQGAGINLSSWFFVAQRANFEGFGICDLIKSISYKPADVCSAKI